MDKTLIYVAILVLYIAGMLFVGFLFNKKSKSSTDYFLAKNKLGPATIGFSFSATQIGGGAFIGAIATTSLLGYNFAATTLGSAAAAWFTFILAGGRIRKIAQRLKSVTISDIFEARYYSKKVGYIATIIMLIAFIPMIAGQMQAAATAFSVILDFPYIAGLLIFAFIVIFYTVIGGMFAVAWTDFIQGILMMAGFLILAGLVIVSTGGIADMNVQYAELNPEGIGLTGIMSPAWVICGLIVWGLFQVGGSPQSVTRFLIPKDDKTLKKSMGYAIFFNSLIFFCFLIIAIGASVMIPELQGDDMLMPTLTFEHLNPFLGGVVLAATMGAMMSTISSILLLAGSLFSVNILNKLSSNRNDPSKNLKIGRIVTAIVGILSLLLAIDPPAAILWMLTISMNLLASAFTFPLLLGIWWKRATKEGGLWGIIGGLSGCVFWYILGYIQYQSFSDWVGGIWPAIFGGVISLLLVIIVSKLTKPSPQEVTDIFFNDDVEADKDGISYN